MRLFTKPQKRKKNNLQHISEFSEVCICVKSRSLKYVGFFAAFVADLKMCCLQRVSHRPVTKETVVLARILKLTNRRKHEQEGGGMQISWSWQTQVKSASGNRHGLSDPSCLGKLCRNPGQHAALCTIVSLVAVLKISFLLRLCESLNVLSHQLRIA